MKIFLITICLYLFDIAIALAQPIALHPKNPHYFLFKGKITPLITSGEHYGAVINMDFDYLTYLNELKASDLNYTRIFTGMYVESPGAFGIERNTIGVKPNRLLTPWQRSSEFGYFLGGNKFDLNKWNSAYFSRLKDFVKEAGKRGIVVEITLFTSLYGDEGWKSSPLNSINNINKTDSLERRKVHTLDNKNILKHQEQMIRKIVQSVNEFDNIIFEIQNEPWADNGDKIENKIIKDNNSSEWEKTLEIANEASMQWQKFVVKLITDTERTLPKKHLIAQNFANFIQDLSRISSPKEVSIYNFHYAFPKASLVNYPLNKVLGFDESGFAGSADSVYRAQAWRWMLAGGGLFNNLDYSFSAEKPHGTEVQKAPGGGSPALRKQLKFLKEALSKLELETARPDTSFVKSLSKTTQTHCLRDNKNAYLIYLEKGKKANISLKLSIDSVNSINNKYLTIWYDPKTGKLLETKTIVFNESNIKSFESPDYQEDIVLYIVKIDSKKSK